MSLNQQIEIVEIGPGDAPEFRTLRLRGLEDHPEAFGESAEEFARLSVEDVAARLTARRGESGFILGARRVGDRRLIGVVGIGPDRGSKSAHRAMLWGVYVAPEARGQGVSRRLIEQALERCRREGRIEQVRLGVATDNAPALAVYRSLGFVEYGREPRVLRVNGRDYDEYLMVIELNARH